MLIEFRLNNFRCFRDEVVFSLVASNDDSNIENLITFPEDDSFRLLKSGAFYGANASGKTTIVTAIDFVRDFILESATYDPKHRIPYNPFLLDNNFKQKGTGFEFVFIEDGVRYRYGFEILKNKVVEEWLFSYPKGRQRKLFMRTIRADNKYDYVYSSYLKGEKVKLEELTKSNSLYLSIGAFFNNETLQTVYSWFSDDLKIIYAGAEKPFDLFSEDATEEYYYERLQSLLANADIGVIGLDFEESKGFDESVFDDVADEETPEDMKKINKIMKELIKTVKEIDPKIGSEKTYEVTLIHEGKSEPVRFPYKYESAGTKQIFRLSLEILRVLNNGGVLIIDELHSSLHPNLSNTLISLFHNEKVNKSNAQLIFNTHDTSLLNPSIFRRDQIWFVEKCIEGAAHIYSLMDYSPRKNEAIEKGYIQGRYGAIPFIGDIDWELN